MELLGINNSRRPSEISLRVNNNRNINVSEKVSLGIVEREYLQNHTIYFL